MEELMVEYLEDAIEEDPNQRFAPEALESGEIMPSTGDPVVDQWERDLAAGRSPDFTKGLDPEAKARLKKMLGNKAAPPIEAEFSDDYTKGG